MTIFLLILLPIGVRAQIEVGVRNGIAFSKQKYDNFGYPPLLSNHVIGVDAGVMLNWFFMRSLFLQPELNFIQKGGIYPNGANKINHLELATLLGYEKKSEELSAFVSSGLFLDKVINIPKDEGGPLAPYQPDEFEDNKWGLGLIHSGGASVKIGKGWIGLAGRYRHSLTDFRHVYGVDVNGDPSHDPIVNFRNKGWSINLTYKIEIQ